jgi:transcriptional regulator with XRE-family HTH domain
MKDQLANAEQQHLDYTESVIAPDDAPQHVKDRAKLGLEAGNLIDLRRLSGFTQQRFADLIGASRGALANWEQDRTKQPARLAHFAAKVMFRIDWADTVTCKAGVQSSFKKEPRGICATATHVYEMGELDTERKPDRIEEFMFTGLKRERTGKGWRYQ